MKCLLYERLIRREETEIEALVILEIYNCELVIRIFVYQICSYKQVFISNTNVGFFSGQTSIQALISS